MGNVVLDQEHLKLLNEYMVNGGDIKAATKKAKLSYTQAKAAMKRPDVQREIRRRQQRMTKRSEDKVEQLKERILEEAMWSPPSLAGITIDPEKWLEDHNGERIYGSLTIDIIPARAKHGRKSVKVSYKSPTINEIVALRNQAIEIFGLKRNADEDDVEYLLIQKLNAGRQRSLNDDKAGTSKDEQ